MPAPAFSGPYEPPLPIATAFAILPENRRPHG